MDTSSRYALVRRTLLTVGVATAFGFSVAVGAADDSAPTAHSDSVGAAVSDTAITAKVKATFVGKDALRGSHIKVTTTNGVVTLTGSALNGDAKSSAEDLAHSVDGVKSVDDELVTGAEHGTVHRAAAKTGRVGSDSWITTKVKSEILSDSLSKGFDVHVKTLHGVVMLRGKLPNEDAVAHVKDLAEKVEGVKSVNTAELTATAG